jgi:hypothetical protein
VDTSLEAQIKRLVDFLEVQASREERVASTVSGAGEGAEIYRKYAQLIKDLRKEVERLEEIEWMYNDILNRLGRIGENTI